MLAFRANVISNEISLSSDSTQLLLINNYERRVEFNKFNEDCDVGLLITRTGRHFPLLNHRNSIYFDDARIN